MRNLFAVDCNSVTNGPPSEMIVSVRNSIETKYSFRVYNNLVPTSSVPSAA